jgi:hypothetical protein
MNHRRAKKQETKSVTAKPYEIVVKAEDEYMPSGPPMSPLTRSFFTTWAFFDLRFGPHKETLGNCLLDAGTMLDFDAKVIDVIRTCSESRMGIYEEIGLKGGRCLFKELITDEQFECHVPTDYQRKLGGLWYGRVLPPIAPIKYRVFLTTPYILVNFGREDWTAYLKKSLLNLKVPEGDATGLLPEARERAELLERIHLPGVSPPPVGCHFPGGATGCAGKLAPRSKGLKPPLVHSRRSPTSAGSPRKSMSPCVGWWHGSSATRSSRR